MGKSINRYMKVYWIKRQHYTDIATEGYVGITNHFFIRRWAHQNYQGKNKKLQGHMKKYNDVVVEVVFEGTKEECIALEKKYRPTSYIGWNQLPGGGLPPMHKGKHWYNNGVKSKLAFECPEGYKPGRIQVSGKKHGHYGKKKNYKTVGFVDGSKYYDYDNKKWIYNYQKKELN